MTWNYTYTLFQCEISVLILYYNYIKCNQWGNWVKSKSPRCIIFTTSFEYIIISKIKIKKQTKKINTERKANKPAKSYTAGNVIAVLFQRYFGGLQQLSN